MKKKFAIFFILILIFSNLSTSLAYAQTNRNLNSYTDPRFSSSTSINSRSGVGLSGERINLGAREERNFGEDIIVNVDTYEPKIIRSALLEEQDVKIRALLVGTPSNPSITIPRIRGITSPRRVNITTVPSGKKVSVGSIRWFPPSGSLIQPGRFGVASRNYRLDPTYNNLGYLVIPIRKITKEEDVPDRIEIDVETRVNFDVSRGLGFGPSEDVLIGQSEREWLNEREQHSFFGGYLRAQELKGDRATFVIYDNNLKSLREVTIREGATGRFSLPGGYSRFGNLFDGFQIKVNDIKELSDRVKVLVYRGGSDQFSTRVLTKGSSLYPGSNWIVNNINFKNNGSIREVKFINRKNRNEKIFSMTQIICNNLPQNQCEKETSCAYSNNKCVEKVVCGTIKSKTQCDSRTLCEFDNTLKFCKNKAEIKEGPNRCYASGGTCTDTEGSFCPDGQKNIGEGKSVNCGIREDFDAPTSYDEICCLPIKKEEQNFNKLVSKYNEVNKNNLDEIKQKIIEPLKAVVIDTSLNKETRISALNLLKNKVTNDLETLSKNLISKNEKEEDVDAELRLLLDFITSNEQKNLVSPESKDEATSIKDLWNLAIQSYTQLIRDFPNEQDSDGQLLSVKARERIATVNYVSGDREGAIKAYEDLLNQQPKYKEKQLIDTRIKNLKGLLTNFGTKPETLEEDGEEIIIKLLEVKKSKDEQQKVTLQIDNRDVKVGIGDIIINEKDYDYVWKIESIKEKSVVIRRQVTDSRGTRTERITLTTSLKGVPIGKNKSDKRIKIKNVDLKREAHITILPDTESAFSEASFTIHVDVDKRAIRDSIFSSSLDKEINKTRKLIERVDKLIKDMEKVHKFWINFCYVTFGSLWAKNLIQGVFTNEGIAREKIRDKWVEDYNKARKDGKAKGTFDNYVINNADKYNKDLKAAEGAINSIQSGALCDLPKKEMVDLQNKDRLKDYCFSKIMYNNPDPSIKERYVTQYEDAERDLRLAFERDKVDRLSKEKEFKKVQDELKKAGIIVKDKSEYLLNKDRILITYNNYLERRALGEYFYGNPNITSLSDNPKENKGFMASIKDTCLVTCFKKALNHVRDTQYAKAIGFGPTILSKFSTRIKGDQRVLVDGRTEYEIYSDSECDDKKRIGTAEINVKNKYYVKKPGCGPVQFGEQKTATLKYTKKLSVNKGGKAKGLIEFISVSPLLYAQIDYSTGGARKGVTIFKRTLPNAELGTGTALGDIASVIKLCGSKVKSQQNILTDQDCKGLREVSLKVNTCNSQLGKRNFKTGAPLRCGYPIEDVKTTEVGRSCVDFMSPQDCAILFNACDPVLCPSSRCNFNGRWQVNNVAQTGIVGSLVLCSHNSVLAGGEVAVPVCLTGLLGGLQNIKSMLQGYNECLNVKKVEGKSVGICDKIRNVYMCDILWREGIAIFNLKNGLLGILSDKLFDVGKGGGEYANFKGSLDNSVNTLKFFTQDYAKTVFASYSGGSLDEIGTEICKSFIGAKLPGEGFFDQITRPVSPPQFTAILDSLPFSEVGSTQQSQYSVFHHIYAGANEPITYSVYLRAVDQDGRSFLPFSYIIRNKRLDSGSFNEENNDFTAIAGYNEVCVEINSRTQTRRVECGFGKVTTDFGVNMLNNIYTAKEAQKKINSAEECVPEAGRLTSLNYQSGSNYQGGIDVTQAVVGSFSTGLTQTGIVRKCSGFNPGIGTSPQNWVAVGTCGQDNKKRDLGTCWLYRPAVSRLIKDTQLRNETEINLKSLQKKLAEEGLTGLNVLSQEESLNVLSEADKLFEELKKEGSEEGFRKLTESYRLASNTLIENIAAKALFRLGNSYEEWAKFRKGEIKTRNEESKELKEIEKCPGLFVYDKSKYKSDLLACPSTCSRQEGCFCGLKRGYTQKNPNCGSIGQTFTKEETGLDEDIKIETINGVNDITAESSTRVYSFVRGEWISIGDIGSDEILDIKKIPEFCKKVKLCIDYNKEDYKDVAKDYCNSDLCNVGSCSWDDIRNTCKEEFFE